MAKREPLPAEIHDHFAKANVLHKYVQDDLGEAAKHALETGEYLMAAKLAVPHGSWESECDRLFDGSARLARSYMQFATNMSALPKRQTRAILMLEGTLDGAAKAAKNAANPKPPKPEPAEEPDEPIDVDSEPVDTGDDVEEEVAETPVDYGKCPNCLGSKWTETDDGVICAKCKHPHGEATGGADEDRVATMRQKSRKTAEALMRCFDDLQHMKSNSDYTEAVAGCKRLLAIAKGWK